MLVFMQSSPLGRLKMELTKELVNELFEYRDGVLYWKSRNAKTKYLVGTKAGYVHKLLSGYEVVFIRIQNISFREHRLIYLMHHGYLPDSIDHIDGNSLNNRIENLRPANVIENQQNAKLRTDNTSGVKGVYWSKQHGKWKAQIKVAKRQKYLGLFDELEFAELVVSEARNKYHGQYARHA